MSIATKGQRAFTSSAVTIRRRRIHWNRVLLYTLAILVGLYVLIPLYWVFAQALMTEQDIYHWPPYIIPPKLTLANFTSIFTMPDIPIVRWFFNSAFVAFSRVALELVVGSLTAYAFARLEFPGRDKIFFAILTTMMIPGQVTLIPLFLQMRRLHWIDTYHALIWPGMAAVFPVFLLRQFFQTLPKELDEAAVLDGCSSLGVLRHVIIPLSTPALSALSIFVFMGNWNALLWPLIITNRLEMRTLVPGLTIVQGTYYQMRGMIMATAAFTVIPVMIFYSIFQRRIIEGVTMTGFAGG